MSYGLTPFYETKINRAFSWILKNVKQFYLAQTYYSQMKEKDLTKSGSVSDMKMKVDTINEYQKITKQDLLSDKFQNKVMWESFSVKGK